jgi:hypothetical protein
VKCYNKRRNAALGEWPVRERTVVAGKTKNRWTRANMRNVSVRSRKQIAPRSLRSKIIHRQLDFLCLVGEEIVARCRPLESR